MMLRYLWAVSAFVLLLPSCSEQQTEERENVIGYMGRAKKNPYLAAERYLESAGHEVMSSTGVLKLNDEEGVVIAPASSIRSIGDAQRVLEWVEQGGHFVCFLDRGEDYWRDLGAGGDHAPSEWRSQREHDEENGLQLILKTVELSVHEWEDDDEEWSFRDEKVTKGLEIPNSEPVSVVVGNGMEFEARLGGARYLVPDRSQYYQSDWHDQSNQHYFFSRTLSDDYGGRVTFIADGRIFRNPYLKFEDHAELLDTLTATSYGKVVFSLGKVRSFTSMLGEYASHVLWALLVLTVLWLWKSLPRFGPLLEVADGDARNYAQQVKNTGQFLWRNKCADTLVIALRKAVARKLGHFNDQDTESLIDALSASSKIDRDLVAEAMTRSDIHDAASMVRISKTLQQLLNSL